MASGHKVTNEEFISRAKKVHGDRYDYSEIEMTDMRTNITIICPKHGRFRPLPKQFLAGGNCPCCARESKSYNKKLTTEEFIEKAKAIHGDDYSYEHTEYRGMNSSVLVTCKKHGDVYVRASWFLAGSGCNLCGMDKKKSLIEGVGINDKNSESRSLSYRKWTGMLKRCYNESSLKKHPSYEGCSVDERWHRYSIFKEWFDANYKDGYELDKDILVKGNKVYGPDTCCMVPKRINALLVSFRSKGAIGVIGVSKRKRGRQYVAHCSKNITKNGDVEIGYFNTVEDAFFAYKNMKEAYIKQIAKEYYDRGEINQHVYDALMRYEVEITD